MHACVVSSSGGDNIEVVVVVLSPLFAEFVMDLSLSHCWVVDLSVRAAACAFVVGRTTCGVQYYLTCKYKCDLWVGGGWCKRVKWNGGGWHVGTCCHSHTVVVLVVVWTSPDRLPTSLGLVIWKTGHNWPGLSVATMCNWSYMVWLQLWEFLRFLRPVQLWLHPKWAKRPDQTGL